MTRTRFSGIDAALRRSFVDVVDAAEDLLRSTADDASTEYRRARRTLETSVRSAKEHVADRADELAADARAIGDDANRFVRANPWVSAGIGAAIGLIAGVLLRRR
jgi:ElaB/YqjD/DUF883 family membrane-anchored ribosome-binding protein